MAEALSRTPLYDEHVRLGGKMVPFAGFEMPVHYASGITAEHHLVRDKVGLFDVTHMGEFEVRGPQARDLVQHLTVNDASRVDVGQAQYSAMCREGGGIIDDLLVYRYADHWMLVVNASNRPKDLAWVQERGAAFDAEVTDRSDEFALLAIQGPRAQAVLAPMTETDLDGIGYYRFAEGAVAGVEATISRTGYTGEDGFELYVAANDSVGLWRALLEAGEPAGLGPAGLGARDSLRLEMGYALYGNDLDEDHTPLECGLGWIVKLDRGDFVGREALVRQKAEGVSVKLVGLRLTERGFPRPGYDILSDGAKVGVLTSGTVSPSLGDGIAMGFVPPELGTSGAALEVDIRGKPVGAVVQRPPFYDGGSIKR